MTRQSPCCSTAKRLSARQPFLPNFESKKSRLWNGPSTPRSCSLVVLAHTAWIWSAGGGAAAWRESCHA
eukprot:2594914-Heterocapsa_arctica.AAC.1